MAGKLALALVAGLAAFAGCLEGLGGSAAVPADDGSLAWLLPVGSEVPPELRRADDGSASRFLEGPNPGPLTSSAWRAVSMVSDDDVPQPQEVVAAIYVREDEPRHVVVVVAARFAGDPAVDDWRAFDDLFGMGDVEGSGDEEDPDDYSVYWAMCGLRARYGFVRGHDVLLVMGNLDVTGNTPPGKGVRGPSLELEATLRDRADGSAICTERERAIHRHLAVEEGSLAKSRLAADGLEDVDLLPRPPAAATTTTPAEAMNATTSTAPAQPWFAPPGAKPLEEGDGGASARHGRLAPGETQWFSFEAVGHSCLYMGFRGEMGEFEVLDAAGESADLGWAADRRDGAYGFNQDLHDAGRFFLRVQAYPQGTGVDELWLELTPGDCPLHG